jgi:hypothetical protein
VPDDLPKTVKRMRRYLAVFFLKKQHLHLGEVLGYHYFQVDQTYDFCPGEKMMKR